MKKLLVLLAAVVLLGSGCIEEPPKPQCLVGHMEKRHKAAYVTTVYNAALKMNQPVSHPAKDWEEFVCDEYVTTTSAVLPTSTPEVASSSNQGIYFRQSGSQECVPGIDVQPAQKTTGIRTQVCQVEVTDADRKTWCFNAKLICP